MYCQACGIALSQPMKYCNRCGTLLVSPAENAASKTARDKRLDAYLEGLFWITIFGVAFVLGGMIALKKLQFSDLLIICYMVLTATLFLINFALNLWGAIRLGKQALDSAPSSDVKTSELPPSANAKALSPPPSVIENTTRSFEHLHVKQSSE